MIGVQIMNMPPTSQAHGAPPESTSEVADATSGLVKAIE